MPRFSNPLSRVRVASPCTADWDSMIGDERVRFCGQCELNVYNLSALTRAQAENLISGTEGRLCVRFHQRKDGSILTQDCPVGLRALRRRMSRFRRALAAAILGFFAGSGGTVAVKGLKSVLVSRPLNSAGPTMGTLAESVKPIAAGPTMGKFAFEGPLSQGRIVRQKRGRR